MTIRMSEWDLVFTQNICYFQELKHSLLIRNDNARCEYFITPSS